MRVELSRGQPTGALHSRTTENSMAAANTANTKVRLRILINASSEDDRAKCHGLASVTAAIAGINNLNQTKSDRRR
jgi:hypothetical protein